MSLFGYLRIIPVHHLSERIDILKLNFDCIRDVLITLENELQPGNEFQITLNDLSVNFFSDYLKEDVGYSLIKLKEAGYIDAVLVYDDLWEIFDVVCHDITFDGHTYLNSVRSSSLWADIKRKCKDNAIDLSFAAIIKAAATLTGNLVP